MRVEYPGPYPFSQVRTSRSSRTATSSFDLGRNADASCSSVSGGMPWLAAGFLALNARVASPPPGIPLGAR
jgi:hypothetical protein